MSKDLKNLFIAILLSTLVLIAWQYFYESPRKAKFEAIQEQQKISKLKEKEDLSQKARKSISDENIITDKNIEQIKINTAKLQGTISLKGLRFDDLQLKDYQETLAKDSPLVQLFSKNTTKAYFAEFGWIKDASDNDFNVPNKDSIWKCDHLSLTDAKPVNCYWRSPEDIYYHIKISVDANYLFTISQTIENNSDQNISVASYGRIYKAAAEPKQFAILHEGCIGVFSDVLKESTYEDLSKEKQEIFTNTQGSWGGFTNKYWLSALVSDSSVPSKTHFLATKNQNEADSGDSYNVNFISQDINLMKKSISSKLTHYLFAGAKEEKILNHYEKEKGFALFDRAIDYGMFYFITKPLLLLISYFYSLIGNFGLAIILVTLTLKLLMYPLANKSYVSMEKMKKIQPKIEQIKQKYSEDKMKFNQEIMELYKREKVNPAAGCLPLLIQIPLFFSLYKVIFISLEMRHAPFYGWIKDLSAADPTSIWNLFGLLPWGSLGMLDIGLWPLIMAITMFLQQRLSPAPADPIQATVMKFMPVLLVVMLYSLPSGLMIYWSVSNILSIFQQYMISRNINLK